MKQFLLLLILATVTIGKAPAQNLDNPGEYMTALTNAHTDMDKKYMAYISASAHGKRARKVEKLRKQVIESIESCKFKVIDLPYYKGDNSLRQSNIDYIQMCYNIFNEDYTKIVNMEEILEQSVDEMEAYLLLKEKTNEKLEQAAKKLHEASKAFAAKYNVTLIESETDLGAKMTAAGKVNQYYNKIYLIIYKCSWQDDAITKAINDKKVNDAEQARAALIKYANEGLAALDTIKGFNGDISLTVNARQLLKHYKKAAETDIPKMTDFLIKAENFEKLKKSIDSKSSPSKEDIDAYNKAVKEFNDGVNIYNNTNNSINQQRTEALNNWENAVKVFYDTHVPYFR